MMKQPAENTNATPAEEEAAKRRAEPNPSVPREDEVASLAGDYAQARGASGPEEEDLVRAREVLRNSKLATQKP